MADSNQHLKQSLKEVREAQELSQRELSERSGLPQSHISNIENGSLDPRVSSLIKLADVLGLEVMLVPKNSISFFDSITKRFNLQTVHKKEPPKELKQFRSHLAQLTQKNPTNTELAEILRQVRELVHFEMNKSDLRVLKSELNALKNHQIDARDQNGLLDILSAIEHLRVSLARRNEEFIAAKFAKPMYSLEALEDD